MHQSFDPLLNFVADIERLNEDEQKERVFNRASQDGFVDISNNQARIELYGVFGTGYAIGNAARHWLAEAQKVLA